MGWLKKIIRVIAPGPSIVVDLVKGKEAGKAVTETVTAPIQVPVDAAAAVIGAVADIDNKLTQMEATLIGKIGGDKARNLFLDLRRISQPLDIQMQKQLIDSTQQFVNTLDPAFLNPFVPALATELQDARNNFWDKALPIPEDVIKVMPPELAGVARNARHLLVADANLLSLPTFAIKHFRKATAVSVIDLIFFENIPNSETEDGRFYWAHEITHLMQYQNLGLVKFAEKYFHEEWKRIGDEATYINALEEEADISACKHFPGGKTHYIGGCPTT